MTTWGTPVEPPPARRAPSAPGTARSPRPEAVPGASAPASARRAAAAFEDTQAMGQIPADRPTQVVRPGPEAQATRLQETAVAPPRYRGASGPGGPGGPDGPGGPGGPGGPDGPEDGDRRGRRRARRRPAEGARRTGWKRFIPNWKIVMAGLVVISAGVFGMIAVAYANTPLPVATQDAADDQGSILYYSDGKTEIARLGIKREIVPITKIPKHVQDAVIAAENRTFREDAGISISGILRSVWNTVTGTQVQGGSTITQQMVRNYYDGLSQERSISRKVKEIFVAIRVDREMSKDEILANYLNTIYFGRGAYGIQAAAKAFFGRDVSKLTLAQAAYLAGRIQNPDAFDRAEQSGNNAPTEERFRYVLEGLPTVDPSYAPQVAKAKYPKRIKYRLPNVYRGIRGYMIDIVQRELKQKGITEEDLKKDGLRIRTTFDRRLMLAAKKAVESNLAALGDKDVRANLAAVDPRNGRVLAFYSGKDYLKSFTNNAFDARKQAASAFKPYVLAAWLEQGWSLKSYVLGKGPIELPGTKPIKNSHDVGQAVRIDVATAQSVNTAFAQMAQEVGLDKVIAIAEAAGIDKKSLEQAERDHRYALSIGSGLVTPIEQAAGYSIFANGGKYSGWHVVREVRNTQGTVLVKESQQPKEVISPESAADAIYALQQVVKTGTARGTTVGPHPIAGKTGTNDNNKEAWFVGFTPQVSAAVGMYKEVVQRDPKTGKILKDANGFPLPKEVPMSSSVQGATWPTRIWDAFMEEAMKGKEVLQFPQPVFLGEQHDLEQKPAPSPTPTQEDPFLEDGGDGGFSGDCPPQDPACSFDGGGGEEEPVFEEDGIPEGGTFSDGGDPGFGAGPGNGGVNGAPGAPPGDFRP